MISDFEERCKDLLMELELCTQGAQIDAQRLTGGVASDIALVKVGKQRFCVKFALPKLKVAADWFAPVHRNAAEYAWLEIAARLAPESSVRLFGRSESLHGFAMEYLEGEDIYLWKSELLDEAPERSEAEKVGRLLGKIHQASTSPDFEVSAFRNRSDFFALRIEPYITFTALHHADVKDYLNETAEMLDSADQVLVHGDVSPKNILFRKSGPVILDAECATMGDASFDPSFCMNHLVLKAVHLPKSRNRYLSNAMKLWRAYAPFVSWEAASAVESRICRVLPALLLGRIDGKSPVEYLSDEKRKIVRKIALDLLLHPSENLKDIMGRVAYIAKEFDT